MNHIKRDNKLMLNFSATSFLMSINFINFYKPKFIY